MLKKLPSLALYAVCCSSFTLSANTAQTGLASYYSNKFQGNKTSTGERYDKNKLTAAHRTLALGSKVEITNVKTHRSVVVTINDRGPYRKKVIVDLSYAAAKALGIVQAGIAPVSINMVNSHQTLAANDATLETDVATSENSVVTAATPIAVAPVENPDSTTSVTESADSQVLADANMIERKSQRDADDEVDVEDETADTDTVDTTKATVEPLPDSKPIYRKISALKKLKSHRTAKSSAKMAFAKKMPRANKVASVKVSKTNKMAKKVLKTGKHKKSVVV